MSLEVESSSQSEILLAMALNGPLDKFVLREGSLAMIQRARLGPLRVDFLVARMG